MDGAGRDERHDGARGGSERRDAGVPFHRLHGGRADVRDLSGHALTAGTDYFATVDAASQSLWLTLNGNVTGPVTLQVQ